MAGFYIAPEIVLFLVVSL